MSIVVKQVPLCDRRVFDILEDRKLLVKEIPDLQLPGVYVLYEGRIPYYIGMATKLFSRLHDHANKSTDARFHHWNYFQAFVIPDPAHRVVVEGILCAAFPTANKSNKKFPMTTIPTKVTNRIREAKRRAVMGS